MTNLINIDELPDHSFIFTTEKSGDITRGILFEVDNYEDSTTLSVLSISEGSIPNIIASIPKEIQSQIWIPVKVRNGVGYIQPDMLSLTEAAEANAYVSISKSDPSPELHVNPTHSRLTTTGIYVRAKNGDKWDNYDIVDLDEASLLTWLRSRGGENPWAENVVGILLGHKTPLVT